MVSSCLVYVFASPLQWRIADLRPRNTLSKEGLSIHLIAAILMFNVHSDVIRHASHSTRTSTVQPSRSRTASSRFQRYGLSILLVRQKLRSYRSSLFWNRMLYRRLPSEVRPAEFGCRWLYNRRSSCIQSWTAGRCIGLCWIRCVFRSHRLLHADARRISSCSWDYRIDRYKALRGVTASIGGVVGGIGVGGLPFGCVRSRKLCPH